MHLQPGDVFLITIGLLTQQLPTVSGAVGFGNSPTDPQDVHENNNNAVILWSITSATCNEDYTCGCPSGTCTCTREATCDTCSITGTTTGLFILDGWDVKKIACSNPTCGPVCSDSGCVNSGESYPVGVQCFHSSRTTDTISASFTVDISANAAPTFTFTGGISITVGAESINTVVNTIVGTDSDASIDGDSMVYYINTQSSSEINGNTLFAVNSANGEIYTQISLALEYEWDYTMDVCVRDNRRRDSTCQTLSIRLSTGVTFSNNPGTVSVHENYDSIFDVWANIASVCNYAYNCNVCSLHINPSSLFQMNGLTVQKIQCTNAGCGPTCSASGCLNGPDTHTVGVMCHHTSDPSYTASTTFTVSVTKNAAPTFTFSSGISITVGAESINTVVNTMVGTDSDASIDGDSMVYYINTQSSSEINGNTLFDVNSVNGQIYTQISLALEYEWDYTMDVCVRDDRRRDSTCQTLSIRLSTGVTFSNNPGTVSVHENYDSIFDVWANIASVCNYAYYCNVCSLHINPSSLFQMNGLTVQKIQCTNAGCGPTCSASGCLNGPDTHTVGVTCHHTSDSSYTTSTTFTVSVTKNAAPTFTFSNGAAIDVYKASATTNTVVNTMMVTDTDANIDSDTHVYTLSSGPRGSWIHNNVLFDLNTANGEIYVTSSLDLEFSYDFTMTLCVHDFRREDQTCNNLAITLHACFQTPNCTDQWNLNVYDTRGASPHGLTDPIFSMIYPLPTDHFPNFYNSGWQQLTWTVVSSDISTTSIDSSTGDIFTTDIGFLPIYPNWYFTMVIQVANSESCYTQQCTMRIRVWYTQRPVEITSIDVSPQPTTNAHEDYDLELLLHCIVVFDFNYDNADSITCGVTNDKSESNLFRLDHTDEYSTHWDAYCLYKEACLDPDCGYKTASFLCTLNRGCMNYDISQQYIITIDCLDGQGSTATEDFTFTVNENAAPVYSNLPKSIVENSDSLSDIDTVYNIQYSDAELETLYYLYTYGPVQDFGFFQGSTSGDYSGNLANISMTTHLWNLTTDTTYTVLVCGHERRNEICETLTIDIKNYCNSPIPQCTAHSVSVTTEYAVGGQLFSIYDLVSSPGTYSGLSYSLASDSIEYFSVNSGTGAVTTIKTLTADYPSTVYTMNAYVYDTDACGYGVCVVTVTVTPVNYPLLISNLPATTSIHEDIVLETIIFTISTTDPNTDDTVSCSITAISPTPIVTNPTLFYLKEIVSGSDVFSVASRDTPGFTSATTTYTVSIRCEDRYASFSTGELTVNILLNQQPVISNLDAAVNVDPATILSGTVIYTVSVTDTENDAITYACSVLNSYVPLECIGGQIALRRNVDVITENNVAYAITVTIGDTKHPSSSSGVLTATFTSSRTPPVLNNLPASVSTDESAGLGTLLFDVNWIDPDVGETWTVIKTVDPASATSMFALDSSTGVLTTAAFFDYESGTTSYTITFSVSDEYLSAAESKDLTVSINNVNEQPTLTVGTSTITFLESTAVGTELTDPQFTCTDPDASETLTFTINSGIHAAYFTINSATGALSLAQSWDFESTALPTSSSLVIACTDSGTPGLSATAAVTMSVSHVNEYNPSATYTTPGGTTVLLINGSTSVVDDLLTVTASDLDSDDDGQFVFTILGPANGMGNTYFVMSSTGSATGVLRLKEKITLGYPFSTKFTIKDLLKTNKIAITATEHRCICIRTLNKLGKTLPKDTCRDICFNNDDSVSDGEASEKFTGILVTANYTPSAASVESTSDSCVSCTTKGKFLIVFLGLEGLIIAIIIAHIIIRFCFHGNKICASSEATKVTEVTRPRFSSAVTRNRASTSNNVMEMTRVSNATGISVVVPVGRVRLVKGKQMPVKRQVNNSNNRSSISSDSNNSSSSSSDTSDDEPQRPDNRPYNPFGRINYAGKVDPNASSGFPTPIYTAHVP